MPQQRPNNSKTQSAFFKAREKPPKTATYSKAREKVRVEAEAKRAEIPPEHRATPYDRPRESSHEIGRTEERPGTKAASNFSKALAEKEQQASEPKMSVQFNTKAGSNEARQSKLGEKVDPEAEI